MRRDLAGRLRRFRRRFKRRLARADVLADMIRAVNSSLEPEKVAEALLSQASEWMPVPAWLVLADGRGRADARRWRRDGLTPPLEPARTRSGSWVMRTGEVFTSACVGQDRRVADTAAGCGRSGFR